MKQGEEGKIGRRGEDWEKRKRRSMGGKNVKRTMKLTTCETTVPKGPRKIPEGFDDPKE
jgi:hypothetical protein